MFHSIFYSLLEENSGSTFSDEKNIGRVHASSMYIATILDEVFRPGDSTKPKTEWSPYVKISHQKYAFISPKSILVIAGLQYEINALNIFRNI